MRLGALGKRPDLLAKLGAAGYASSPDSACHISPSSACPGRELPTTTRQRRTRGRTKRLRTGAAAAECVRNFFRIFAGSIQRSGVGFPQDLVPGVGRLPRLATLPKNLDLERQEMATGPKGTAFV